MNNSWIETYLITEKDFPKPGVTFKWCGPLLRDPQAFQQVVDAFLARYQDKPIDVILGLESRGFFFGSILAYQLSLPFVPVRKCGRLPQPTHRIEFEHEYATECFEIEKEVLTPQQKVLIIDDLLATAGSMVAACQLVEMAQATVFEATCLIELTALKGRDQLTVPFHSLFQI